MIAVQTQARKWRHHHPGAGAGYWGPWARQLATPAGIELPVLAGAPAVKACYMTPLPQSLGYRLPMVIDPSDVHFRHDTENRRSLAGDYHRPLTSHPGSTLIGTPRASRGISCRSSAQNAACLLPVPPLQLQRDGLDTTMSRHQTRIRFWGPIPSILPLSRRRLQRSWSFMLAPAEGKILSGSDPSGPLGNA